MKKFKLFIDPIVNYDIQAGIDYYQGKQKGLGRQFHVAVKDTFDIIRLNPLYQIRYDDIRCLMVNNNFPYMVHFPVDEEFRLVTIHAVINTSKDPEKNWIRK